MRFNNGKQKLTTVTRPYTAYNIFFQLEREYILQRVFQVFPCLELSEIFDRHSKEYNGPLLPPRYSDLILHREWHVPGKGKRNKRSHRVSHGKIGFKQLSQQIAKSWASVGSETRQFCKKYAADCKLQYKSIMAKKASQMSKTAKSSGVLAERVVSNPEICLLVEDIVSSSSVKTPTAAQQATDTSKAFRVSNDSESSIIHVHSTTLDREGQSKMQETPEVLNSIIIDTLFAGLPFFVNDDALVDMEDNTIIDLWHTIHR